MKNKLIKQNWGTVIDCKIYVYFGKSLHFIRKRNIPIEHKYRSKILSFYK